MESLDLFTKPYTAEEQAKHIAAVAAHHGKNEKLAWKRKVKKMDGLFIQLHVYEERILAIVKEKEPLMDDVALLRSEMVKECIHPKDHLVHMNTYLLCKFCEKKISIPRILKDEEPEASESEDVSE